MGDSQIVLPLDGSDTQRIDQQNKWIYANIDYMGYFRVNYDTQNWNKFIDQLKKDYTVFSPTERAGLIFDSFTLAR